MDILTSFTTFVTGEGHRVSYTYSVLDSDGNVSEQNKRGNFVALDQELLSHITAINQYITEHKLQRN